MTSTARSKPSRLTYPLEVDGYRRYVRAARPVAELVLELANRPPSPGRILADVAGRRGRGVATLLRWSKMSAADGAAILLLVRRVAWPRPS